MRKCLLVLVIQGFSLSSYANNGPVSNGLWYYQIGGAQPVRAAANPSVATVGVDGDAQLSMGYSCGKFDPVASVAHTLNQVKDGVDDIVTAMTTAATGAIASLPSLILQRANPGLYDLMQNSLVRAELQLDVATKSCEHIEAAIANGKNPYQDLVVISRGNAWKRTLGFGSTTAATAKKTVDEEAGKSGVPWIFGVDSGGQAQQPIEIVGDLTHAGYNLTLNRSVNDASALVANDTQPITQIWSSPNDARSWVVETFGEQVLTTCESCKKQAAPGRGLLPEIKETQDSLTTELEALTSTDNPPTLDDLKVVSAPGIVITREVIEAIQTLPDPEQQLYTQRLAADVALSRTLEKTLYARRLLSSARQLPEAQALSMVQEHAERTIEEIDLETERLIFEHQARKAILSDTVTSLLQRAQQRRIYSLTHSEQAIRNTQPLLDGRVVD